MSKIEYMGGVGYSRVNLEEEDRERLQQIGKGVSPFLVLPVVRDGELVGEESRLFRQIRDDMYEVVEGKLRTLTKCKRHLRIGGERVH